MILLKKNRRLDSLQFPGLIGLLAERLKKPLPGIEAQLRMSSSIRVREMMNFLTPESATPSSVLILVYPANREILTVFIQRPEYDGIHSGQISLPGGKAETADPDAAFTALREAREEIGIDIEKVNVIGKLTDLYIPPSNYLVSPFVAYSLERPVFTIEPMEVKKIVEVRIADLVADQNIREERFRIRDTFEITAPAYVVNGEIIWGATAMMIAEFCTILKEVTSEITR